MALNQLLTYEWKLENIYPRDSLVRQAFTEMDLFSRKGGDCWLSKVKKIKNSLAISLSSFSKIGIVKSSIKKIINSKFARFWLDSVQEYKIGSDGLDTNKLRFYKTFKGSFHIEPYINLVKNRNQRSYISRIRI